MLDGRLTHLPEHRVLVCNHCRIGLYPGTISKHLRKPHYGSKRPVLNAKQIRSFLNDWLPANLAQPLLDPRIATIPTPTSTQPPIPQLLVHHGYRCDLCPYIDANRKNMRQHFNQTHARTKPPLPPYANKWAMAEHWGQETGP